MTAEDAQTNGSAEASPTPAEDGGGGWEIARQWRLAWRAMRWFVTAAVLAGALMVVGQVYLFHQIFTDIHPWLGWGFIAVMTVFFGWAVALPVARFLWTPVMARPPEVSLCDKQFKASDLIARLKYDATYLRAMRANKELDLDAATHDDVLAALRRLIVQARSARGDAINEVADDIARFERETMQPLLADLDKRVDAYIHAEATAVGAATAVSMNGSVDAFIVLWRNVNMVSRISRLYYGRPHLRASLIILRDVAGTVILSRALDDVSDMAGEAVGGLLGTLGGVIAGPIMDGAINALMTIKLGYLAKRRCRSFEPWSPARSRRVMTEVFAQMQSEAGGVASDLLKACGGLTGAAASAAERAGAGARNAWAMVQGIFGKRTDDDATTPDGRPV